MDKAIKVKWIEALRSGDYKQGKGALRIAGKLDAEHCCLGVLCEVQNIPILREDSSGLTTYGDQISHSSTNLPSSVAEQCGISIAERLQLAVRNDRGESFEKIADHIERNL